MAFVVAFISVLLVSIISAIQGQEAVEVLLTTAQVKGPCCAECPGGLRNCVELFLQGNRTEPCTVTLCEFTVTDITDRDPETGLDLNTITDDETEVISSIELDLGSVRLKLQHFFLKIICSPNRVMT